MPATAYRSFVKKTMIGNDWDDLLAGEFEKPYYKNLREFLKKEYREKIIYPDKYDVLNFLKICSYSDTKLVILGQDPYHNGAAHGLCFSCKEGSPIPQSLKNIFQEMDDDCGKKIRNGNLQYLAEQGVLLMNSVLTVEKSLPNSHKGMGWEILTDKIIELLNQKTSPVVFLLWGRYAQEKKVLIKNPQHLVLCAPHPSPLSAHYGFFGCKHFSQTNKFLEKKGFKVIDF